MGPSTRVQKLLSERRLKARNEPPYLRLWRLPGVKAIRPSTTLIKTMTSLLTASLHRHSSSFRK